MSAKRRGQAQEWLAKAGEDEQSIRAILKEDGAPSTACFLAQQMVEKCLKSLLTFHGKAFRKVHDLLQLAAELQEVEPAVQELLDDLKVLNRYYVSTRYPGDFPEFTMPECQKAFEAAQRVRQFVVDQMEE